MAGIQKGWRRGETTFTHHILFPPKYYCIPYSHNNKENETSFQITHFKFQSTRQITCLLLMEEGGERHKSVRDATLANFDMVCLFFHAFLSGFAVFRHTPPLKAQVKSKKQDITILWLKEMGTDLVVPMGDGEYFLLSGMAGRDVVLNFTVGLREKIIRVSKSLFYKTLSNKYIQ